MRARYYDPGTGRFISEDARMDGSNWYVYCKNNPVGYVDADGASALQITMSTTVAVLLAMATGCLILAAFAAQRNAWALTAGFMVGAIECAGLSIGIGGNPNEIVQVLAATPALAGAAILIAKGYNALMKAPFVLIAGTAISVQALVVLACLIDLCSESVDFNLGKDN